MVKVILKLSDLPGTDAGDAPGRGHLSHANKTGVRQAMIDRIFER